jgi:hypothetical protein
MSRHERRATNRKSSLRPKIGELPEGQRKVLVALIAYWAETSKIGQQLVQYSGSTEEAVGAVCELYDKGLVRFVKQPGEFDGAVGFWVEPILPMGGWEGSRA